MEKLQMIHPMIIHFPIVFILLTAGIEILWLLNKKEATRSLAEIFLYLSVASAIVGVITGYITSDSLGHVSRGHEYVHQHRNLMLWMSGALLISLIWLLISKWKKWSNLRKSLILPLTVTIILLTIGADKGASLAHRYGIGIVQPLEQGKDHEIRTTSPDSHYENEEDEHSHD